MYWVGARVKDICKSYKMKQSTLSNIIRRYKKSKPNYVTKKMGRPRKLSPRRMRMLQRTILENYNELLYTIVAKFNTTATLHLSESIVRRYIQNRIAAQKTFMSKKNMNVRIIWGRTHKDRALDQWANVMFTDESCFTVSPVKNRLRVWRHNGCRLSSKHIILTFKSGYQSVSVWSGFSLHGRTPLVGTVGSFDSKTYRVIIDNHILPFMNKVHDGAESFYFPGRQLWTA